ncbi:response regulator [Fontisphaera persica]|uniref:response regulator transcription factor n=1 Tax=Fontisphaera persica TaxID=2974023 RepID=UPI0024BFDF9E|nr:response regulator [Fontisphaera persica]WCJ58238.1 response regulator [Fontisphaera persica]
MKILIVDDNALALRVMYNHLAKDGHEIITAGCGADCLKILLGPNPPGVAVLDWMMPDIDGLEVCRRVRMEQKDGRTYLLMTTCMQSKEDLIQALDSGADAYLYKPYDSGVFRAHVRAAMRIAEYQDKLRQSSRLGKLPLPEVNEPATAESV